MARSKEVAFLYEKVFEEHIKGNISEEGFMQLSVKYETERDELKLKIRKLQDELSEVNSFKAGKELFTNSVRKFFEMKALTPVLLNELIEKIEVYNIEGTGKNKTQRVVIHYRFVGALEIPDTGNSVVLEARQGVAVEYLTKSA